MKGKAIIPLVLGLCVGLVAVKLLVDTLKKAQASGAGRQAIAAVQAKRDIDAFTQITADMVELVQTTDTRFVPARDRIDKLESVIGRVTGKAIPQYSPVLGSMLAPEGTPPGMVGRIPPGFRAVSVEIDEVSGVAYQLKPNDWVDVIVVMDIESGSGRRGKETIAEVILQRVQVAAIGQATTGKPGEGASKVKAAKSATLLVPEEDVPKLHLAGTRGKVTLAMRGDDTNIVERPASAHSKDLIKSQAAEEIVQTPQPSAAHSLFLQQIQQQQLAASNRPQEPPLQQPHPVTVYRGTVFPGYPGSVQQFTFESKDSARLVNIADGPVDHGAELMNTRRGTRQQPGTVPTNRAPQQVPDEVGPNNTGGNS